MAAEADEREMRVSLGFLTVGLTRRRMTMSYAGSMGHSMMNVDERMEDLDLFVTDDIRGLPSFTEKGSPDYLWEASVDIADLPPAYVNQLLALAMRHEDATQQECAPAGKGDGGEEPPIAETASAAREWSSVVEDAKARIGEWDELSKAAGSPHMSPEQVRHAYAEWNSRALLTILEAMVTADSKMIATVLEAMTSADNK